MDWLACLGTASKERVEEKRKPMVSFGGLPTWTWKWVGKWKVGKWETVEAVARRCTGARK
jgi:hypothetical protein